MGDPIGPALHLVIDETTADSPAITDSAGGHGAEPVLAVELWVPDPRLAAVRVGGEIDLDTAPDLRARLLDQLARRGHVVLDLAAVTFFGLSGISLLLLAHDIARDRGVGLHITGAGHRAVARPLQLSGTDQLLPLVGEPVTAVVTALATGLHSTPPVGQLR